MPCERCKAEKETSSIMHRSIAREKFTANLCSDCWRNFVLVLLTVDTKFVILELKEYLERARTQEELAECKHLLKDIGEPVLDEHGFPVRGCDPAGTYYLYHCNKCGKNVWDYEFTRS